MRKAVPLRHQFVDTIPDHLEPAVLYISLRYRTAVHLCPTGCGEEVVTPLAPNDWTLTFDGTVSLRPSVGNWGLACRSHYWITGDEIEWARTWSREEVAWSREGRPAPAAANNSGWLWRLVPRVRGWLSTRHRDR
jgi:Family of unknown function (DUF6527)